MSYQANTGAKVYEAYLTLTPEPGIDTEALVQSLDLTGIKRVEVMPDGTVRLHVDKENIRWR